MFARFSYARTEMCLEWGAQVDLRACRRVQEHGVACEGPSAVELVGIIKEAMSSAVHPAVGGGTFARISDLPLLHHFQGSGEVCSCATLRLFHGHNVAQVRDLGEQSQDEKETSTAIEKVKSGNTPQCKQKHNNV